jgi:hypothetical protein
MPSESHGLKIEVRKRFVPFWNSKQRLKTSETLGLNSLETDLIRADGLQEVLNRGNERGSKFLEKFGRNFERKITEDFISVSPEWGGFSMCFV